MTRSFVQTHGTIRMLSIFIILSSLPWAKVSCFQYKINASVLGYPDSNDAEIYTTVMSQQQMAMCSIHFNSLTFNSSTGPAVYHSLTKARANFDNPTVAVAIGPFIDVFASTDYVILHQFHLLTSAAGQNAKLMDPKKVVSILPEPQSMAKAIADAVARLQWKNVAFLSQDDFAPVLHLGSNDIQVWPIRLPTRISAHTDQELARNLIELRASEKRKFILHSTRLDIVLHVMTAAKQLQLLHHSIDWFVTYPDFEDLLQNQKWPGSIYGFRLLRKDKIPANVSHLLSGNVSQLDVGLAVDVVGLLHHVLMGKSRGCMTQPSGHDRFVTAQEFKELLKDKTRTYSGALGDYVWSDQDNARTNYSMDILSYRPGRDLPEKVGSVDFVSGDPVVSMRNVTETPTDPTQVFSKGDKLIVVTKQDDPFIIKRGDKYSGFSYDLLEELSKSLKFQFQLVDVTGRERGSGDLGSLVEELLKGRAFMAVGALDVTAKRENVISFSYTILSTHASILIRKGKSTQNFFQFLDPFKLDLWMMILAFITIAGIALYLISRFDPTMQAAGAGQRFDLKESAWYAINILLQGSTEYSPQTTSMRAIIAFFWFSVMIIEAAYTANLAAYLTLQQIDNRIKTIHDLAGQTQVKYGIENNSDLMTFFQHQAEDPYERMWAFMKINEVTSLLDNRSEIIEKVMTGSFAFIADAVTNEYYTTQYCGIESIDQNFGAKDFSFGFPRGAPYRDDINRALLQLKESGTLDDLKRKWWSAGMNCTGEDDTRSVSDQTTAELNITNMVGVFIVLAACILLAILVDLTDRYFSIRRQKQTEKNDNLPPPPLEVFENKYATQYN